MFSLEEPFVQFGTGYYGQHSCEIILNLDQQLRCSNEKVYGGQMPDKDQSQ